MSTPRDLAVFTNRNYVKPTHECPCAAEGLYSYRYVGRYGYVMIGAISDAMALQQAERSIHGRASRAALQRWDDQSNSYRSVDHEHISRL